MIQTPEQLTEGCKYWVQWLADTGVKETCLATYTNTDIAAGELRVWFYDRGRHLIYYWRQIAEIEEWEKNT